MKKKTGRLLIGALVGCLALLRLSCPAETLTPSPEATPESEGATVCAETLTPSPETTPEINGATVSAGPTPEEDAPDPPAGNQTVLPADETSAPQGERAAAEAKETAQTQESVARVLLPSEIVLSAEPSEPCRFDIAASGLDGSSVIEVSVSSQNDFAVLCGETSLTYQLLAGESRELLQNGSIAARFTSDGAQTLEAALAGKPVQAGRYSDVLTFTVRIKGGESSEE